MNTTRRVWTIALVVGLLLLVATPQAGAAADPVSGGVPDATDYCRLAPPAETPGAGVAGFLDPQQELPFGVRFHGLLP